MSRTYLMKLGRATSFSITAAARCAAVSRTSAFVSQAPFHARQQSIVPVRLFSDAPRRAMSSSIPAGKPAPITSAEYHQLADKYLDAVLTQYEDKQDENGDIDVEFSSGVMTVKIPDLGTYVINKQPPNKQIWLASPVSGPKRFDYVVVSEGQDQKQDTGKGQWIYLRTGEKLSELLLKETGVAVED
ncbi:Frataxin [Annulohypoxylon bovei var. microspora]|nr:Frataxin [Annulohypoxylon bovei var. microspora]